MPCDAIVGMTNLCHMVQVAWVPGSFELPVVAKCMAKSGQFDAVVAIGAVVSSRACMATLMLIVHDAAICI